MKMLESIELRKLVSEQQEKDEIEEIRNFQPEQENP